MPTLPAIIDEAAFAWPFTEAAIEVSPAAPGVYLLYRDGRLLYIGLAVNGCGIREELASHASGARGACSHQPRALYHRYLALHRARDGGRLPEGNP
jgi:hypothetical protein